MSDVTPEFFVMSAMWEDAEIFAGIAGSKLGVDKADLGQGIVLSQTYAYASAGFFMWFNKLTPEVPFPNQLRNVEGGFGYEILMQLQVPIRSELGAGRDRLEIVRWIGMLLRLIHVPEVHIPIVSTGPFSAGLSDVGPSFHPLELGRRFVLTSGGGAKELSADHLRWITHHWKAGFDLFRGDRRLNLAIKTFDDGANTGEPALYLLSMWSGLEALFSQSQSELSFRLSAAIAAFLEPPGRGCYDLQRRIKRLYDVRSKIVHGNAKSVDFKEPLIQTDEVVRNVIIRIIESNAVPNPEELMRRLFGDI